MHTRTHAHTHTHTHISHKHITHTHTNTSHTQATFINQTCNIVIYNIRNTHTRGSRCFRDAL